MSFSVSLQGKSSWVQKDCGTDSHGRMLGTRMELEDGRVYRWAKAGAAAVTIGRVIGHAAVTSTLYRDVVVQEARTTAQWDDGDYTVRIGTTGSTSSTALNLVANQYADGYLFVCDLAGQGQMMQVKSHGAESATGSTGGIDITCYDSEVLSIALTTTSQVGLMKNLYKDVVIHTGITSGGPALGVAPVAVDASDYFWAQTWGPCPVCAGRIALLSGQVGIVPLTTGDTANGVAGSVYPGYSTDAKFTLLGAHSAIGQVLIPATADGDFALMFLTIAP